MYKQAMYTMCISISIYLTIYICIEYNYRSIIYV